ncbi:MAG TPA: hypothetical protein VFL85_00045 [Candidatus Saccharimonadales bacterium]|nr:hypothetical protein [Candidatus Saccharimonadales bacterium]
MSGGEQLQVADSELHPRMLAERNQQRLDALWPDLQDEVEMWSLRLQDCEDNPQQFGRLANEAVSSLDAKWPFTYHCFLVSGRWRLPQISQTSNNLEWNFDEPSDAFNLVQSYGFGVAIDNGHKPQIGLSFIIGQHQVHNAAISGSVLFTSFANPAEISMTYVRPPEMSNRQLIFRTAEALEHYDKLLELYVQNENSNLYRANWRKQQKFFEGIVTAANEIVTSPGVLTHSQFLTAYAYARNTEADGELFHKFEAPEGEEMFAVRGYVEAAAILETTRLDTVPLRSPADMIDAEAGLCMVLKLDEDCAETFKTTHLFVPTRQAHKMQFEESS